MTGSNAVAVFKYGQLSDEHAETARNDAEWIRDEYQKVQAKTLEGAIGIGRRLLEARETIGHGSFISWVEMEFSFGIKTAQNLMNTAREVTDIQMRNAVSHLPQSVIYRLVRPSTPPSVREYVRQKVDAGEILAPDKVRDMIGEARKAEVSERTEARRTPDQKKARARTERAHAKEEDRLAAERTAKIEAAERAVAFLAQRLGEHFSEFAAMFATVDLYRFREAVAAA